MLDEVGWTLLPRPRPPLPLPLPEGVGVGVVLGSFGSLLPGGGGELFPVGVGLWPLFAGGVVLGGAGVVVVVIVVPAGGG